MSDNNQFMKTVCFTCGGLLYYQVYAPSIGGFYGTC